MSREHSYTISQRAGWTFAGAYNSVMGGLSAAMYAHSVHEVPTIQSAELGGTVGLLTAATCALLYRRDRHVRTQEAQEQSTITEPQVPVLTGQTREIAS